VLHRTPLFLSAWQVSVGVTLFSRLALQELLAVMATPTDAREAMKAGQSGDATM
jgi:hypothetical protein